MEIINRMSRFFIAPWDTWDKKPIEKRPCFGCGKDRGKRIAGMNDQLCFNCHIPEMLNKVIEINTKKGEVNGTH